MIKSNKKLKNLKEVKINSKPLKLKINCDDLEGPIKQKLDNIYIKYNHNLSEISI